jgi:hypothetical protein
MKILSIYPDKHSKPAANYSSPRRVWLDLTFEYSCGIGYFLTSHVQSCEYSTKVASCIIKGISVMGKKVIIIDRTFDTARISLLSS